MNPTHMNRQPSFEQRDGGPLADTVVFSHQIYAYTLSHIDTQTPVYIMYTGKHTNTHTNSSNTHTHTHTHVICMSMYTYVTHVMI